MKERCEKVAHLANRRRKVDADPTEVFQHPGFGEVPEHAGNGPRLPVEVVELGIDGAEGEAEGLIVEDRLLHQGDIALPFEGHETLRAELGAQPEGQSHLQLEKTAGRGEFRFGEPDVHAVAWAADDRGTVISTGEGILDNQGSKQPVVEG
ncbi:MAG: hypothetical protein ACD_75C02253G0001, partial [uncultured bacterium]